MSVGNELKSAVIRTVFVATAVVLAAVIIAIVQASAQQADSDNLSGPIHITAEEQEFAGDEVLAHGNVKVVYKDSTIQASEATLFKNGEGKPEKAIFTGWPKLTQGKNSISGQKLIFDIESSKVIAEGHAHSEVSTADAGTDVSDLAEDSKDAKKPKSDKPQRIITDSDRQEFDRQTDKFEATGHVRVVHGEIMVVSDDLKLIYGENRKPETALFTGHVTAKQGKNQTAADTIRYSLKTKRLQASGNVRSKVIQKGDLKAEAPVKKVSPGPGAAIAATSAGDEQQVDKYVIITSDSQDYSKLTGRVSADGNVHVYYEDMVGMGPKVILVRTDDGKAEKAVFHGRSQVSQPGRRWIADSITLRVPDKRVIAEGNTKVIMTKKGSGKDKAPDSASFRLADRPGTTGRSISASKIEATQ